MARSKDKEKWISRALKIFEADCWIPEDSRQATAQLLVDSLPDLKKQSHKSEEFDKIAQSVFRKSLYKNADSEIKDNIETLEKSLAPLNLKEEFGISSLEELKDLFYQLFRKFERQLAGSDKWKFKDSYFYFMYYYLGIRIYITTNRDVHWKIKNVLLDFGDGWLRDIHLMLTYWWKTRPTIDFFPGFDSFDENLLPRKTDMEELLLDYIAYLKQENKLKKKNASQGEFDQKNHDLEIGAVSIQKVGTFWQIRFKGTETVSNDIKGMRCIAWLVHHPYDPITPRAIEAACDGQDPDAVNKQYSNMEREQLSAEGLSCDSQDGIEIVDEKYKKEVKKTLAGLDESIREIEERNDPSYSEKLESFRGEKQRILETIDPNLNLRGQSRKLGSATERTRQRVAKNIKYLIKKIKKNNFELGSFLYKHITTGDNILYTPPRTH